MLVVLLLASYFFSISYAETTFYDNYALKFPKEIHNATVFLKDLPIPDGTNEITISLWLKQEYEDSWTTFLDYTVPDYEEFWMGKFEDEFQWATRVDTSYHDIRICINQWAHVTLTWTMKGGTYVNSGDAVELFINGVRIDRSQETFRSNKFHGNGVLSIGQDQHRPGEVNKTETSFRGEITSINIWNRVLNADDVIRAYQSKIEGNIVAWSKANWILNGDVKRVPTSVGRRPKCKSQPACNVNYCGAFA